MDLTMSLFAADHFKNQVLGTMLLFRELKLATILISIFLIIDSYKNSQSLGTNGFD